MNGNKITLIKGETINTIVNFNKNNMNGQEEDYYETVNTFIKKRRITQEVFELTSFYVDLDIDKIDSKWDNKFDEEKEYFLEIKKRCKEKQIPYPSRINYSGNGFHLYWDIKELNDPKEYNREKLYGAPKHLSAVYKLILKKLNILFFDLGADSSALDISRVLRMPDTFNSKNIELCKEIYNSKETYLFTDMSNKLLDKTYEEYINQPITDKQIKKLNKLGIVNTVGLTKKRASELITQLDFKNVDNKDYKVKKVNQINYLNKYLKYLLTKKLIKEGVRNVFCFYYGISLSRLDTYDIDKEIKYLSKKINLEIDELKQSINSGIKQRFNNISYKKINKVLNVSNERYEEYNSYKANKNKRVTNDQLRAAKELYIANYEIYSTLSLRKLGKELNVSKTTASNIKKEMKVTDKKRIVKKNKEIIKYKFYKKYSIKKTNKRIKISNKIKNQIKKECEINIYENVLFLNDS